VEEVAEYVGLEKQTIYQYVSHRKIPYVKIPGSNRLRFDREKIDEWLQSGAAETVDELVGDIVMDLK